MAKPDGVLFHSFYENGGEVLFSLRKKKKKRILKQNAEDRRERGFANKMKHPVLTS